MRLIFHIDEGQRYRVADVSVQGNTMLKGDEVLRLVRMKSGNYLDQATIDGDKVRIKDYYGYLGHNVPVNDAVYYQQDRPGFVDVHYEITEHPSAHVGQIIIIGNTVTKDPVIVRQLLPGVLPGQILSYPDLRVAENNLARLNIFENNPEMGIRPTVMVDDSDPNSEVKDIIVNVQETYTGSFMLGAGLNSDAGFTGSIVLNERNFDITRPPTSFADLFSGKAWRGGGQEFRMEAVPGTQLQRYSISWREPFLFDSQYSLGLSAYYYSRIYDEYHEERLGGRINVGRKLNKYWSLSTAVRIENIGISSVAGFAPWDFQSVLGDNFLLGLRAGLSRDSRDSYLRPTEGSVVDLAFEQVLGDFTYPVASVDMNKYWTIYQRPDGSGRHVLAARSMTAVTGAHTPVQDGDYEKTIRFPIDVFDQVAALVKPHRNPAFSTQTLEQFRVNMKKIRAQFQGKSQKNEPKTFAKVS